ncbi:ACT domain-containing protein [Diplocloster modestus]|uniref:ACT domain-containing protein n=1 Tax=Diplocloster modestus TaxID=2850322 RepID=A0ABS6KDX2_9FIRM|nr:ACT domain-containing protein [Diplocloster modestus]MBU9728694.1 ACT domain-containing protein [Diplocloster modestus]
MSIEYLEIKILDCNFSICQVRDYSLVHFESNYCFAGKTDEEYSLVCVTEDVPANFIKRDDGWKAFRIQGVLDFSLIGILSRISALLADNGIGIFALSTFNTDYILTKAGDFTRAVEILSDAGYAAV